MFLLVVVVVAALGGFVPAFVCAITGFLLANWYFTPPFYEFTIAQGENLVALVIFLVVGGVVGCWWPPPRAARPRPRRRAPRPRPSPRSSGTLAASDDPLPQLVEPGPPGVRRRRRRGARRARPTTDVARAGGRGRLDPRPSRRSRRRRSAARLRGAGRCGASTWATTTARCSAPSPGRSRSPVQQRELQADAERAVGLAEANELRTALLAAVSHDLRTPLSSIKASVSSLLQRDVDFTPTATHELLETIDEGADRLNHLDRQPARHEPAADRRAAARDARRRPRGGAPRCARRPHPGRSGERRRSRDPAPGPCRRRAARTGDRQRHRERDRVVAARRAGAHRSVCRAATRRAARRRSRSGHSAVATRRRVPPVPATGRPVERQRGRPRARRGPRVRRGDGRRDRGRRHAGWGSHDGDQLAGRRRNEPRAGRRRRAADPARARDQPPRARLRRRPRARRRARARRSRPATIPTSWCSTSACPASTAST